MRRPSASIAQAYERKLSAQTAAPECRAVSIDHTEDARFRAECHSRRLRNPRRAARLDPHPSGRDARVGRARGDALHRGPLALRGQGDRRDAGDGRSGPAVAVHDEPLLYRVRSADTDLWDESAGLRHPRRRGRAAAHPRHRGAGSAGRVRGDAHPGRTGRRPAADLLHRTHAVLVNLRAAGLSGDDGDDARGARALHLPDGAPRPAADGDAEGTGARRCRVSLAGRMPLVRRPDLAPRLRALCLCDDRPVPSRRRSGSA